MNTGLILVSPVNLIVSEAEALKSCQLFAETSYSHFEN